MKTIVSLIVALAINLIFIQVVVAGPYPQVTPSYTPTVTPPAITVQSPTNNSETTNATIALTVFVTAPTAPNAISTSIYYVYYKTDWNNDNQYLYRQNLTNGEHFESIDLHTNIQNVPQGSHNIMIVASGIVTVREGTYLFQFDSETNQSIVLSVNSIQSSPPIDNQPFPNQTQILTISIVAVVAAIIIVFLALRWKRYYPK